MSSQRKYSVASRKTQILCGLHKNVKSNREKISVDSDPHLSIVQNHAGKPYGEQT